MTEKDKIKAEIERQIKEWRFLSSIEAKYRFETYIELLEFIDSMPEEKPCEELEQAAKSHPSAIYTVSPQWSNEIVDAFKAGAEWQKEQMIQKVFERLEYHIAYYYGKRITDPAEFIKQFKCIMEE